MIGIIRKITTSYMMATPISMRSKVGIRLLQKTTMTLMMIQMQTQRVQQHGGQKSKHPHKISSKNCHKMSKLITLNICKLSNRLRVLKGKYPLFKL